MKKILIYTVAILGMIISAESVFAQTQVAKIYQIDTNYTTVFTDVPQTQCNNVEVPIYGNRPNNGQFNRDSAIIGGIVGGLLGNTVGNGSGKEAATGVGALAGAIIGGQGRREPRQVIGYKLEQRCNQTMIQVTEERIKNYTIWYEWNGIQARSFTYNQYKVGDTIPVTISINAN